MKICKHVTRFEKDGKTYCMKCGQIVPDTKGYEIRREVNRNRHGTEIKSKFGHKKENQWMAKK